MAWTQNLLLRLPNAFPGTIVGTDHILADAQSKAILRANTRALAAQKHGKLLHRISLRAAKARNRIPFAALRVISDAHDLRIAAGRPLSVDAAERRN